MHALGHNVVNNPLVSVILPAYNGARTLRAALDSVLAQTYQPLEILVVDDASTDETPQILASYDSAIRSIRRDSNSGICAIARGEAMAVAQGKYFAFIDQDDLWDPSKTERQVEFMETHATIPLCHTYMRIIDENDKVLEIRHEGRIPPTGPCAMALLEHCFITISSMMVRPNALLHAKQIVGSAHSNTDTETFLQILQSYPAGFGFIPEVLGSYRRWPQSMSRQQWRWGPEDVNALERVYRGNHWKGLIRQKDVHRAIAQACWKNAEHYRHQGQPGRALYFVRKGLHYSRLDSTLLQSGFKSLVQGLLGQGFALEAK